jgi:hypothetical protein
MAILKAGILYFTVVFGTGVVLGPVRLLWAVPRFGTRIAELMEMPVMLVVIVLAARSIVRRLAVPATLSRRLGMGGVALALLLCAEVVLLLPVSRLSLREYVAGLDPVSGTVYFAMLGVLAMMPLLVARNATRPSRSPWSESVPRRASGETAPSRPADGNGV